MAKNDGTKLTAATVKDLDDFYSQFHCRIEAGLGEKLLKMLGCSEQELHLEERTFDLFRLADVVSAVESFFSSNNLEREILGVKVQWHEGGLAGLFSGQASENPVVTERVKVGKDEERAVIASALLISKPKKGDRFVIMITKTGQPGYNQKVNLGYFAKRTDASAVRAKEFFDFAVRSSREESVYRRKAVQPTLSQYGVIDGLEFISFLGIERSDIVLDSEVWDQLDRNLFLFYTKRDALRRTKVGLKRGLLLAGEPGTGKTMLCQHIVGTFEGYTTIYVPTVLAGAISSIVALAKDLQPALVIIEDVDLIAEDRSSLKAKAKSILGTLMNQMEGFSPADDVVFLLTTNHLGAIEPAIIARPGRIDHIISLPKPNADLRRLLIKKSCAGVHATADIEAWVGRTDGYSPASLKELVRKACSASLMDGDTLRLTDAALEKAFKDLESQAQKIAASRRPAKSRGDVGSLA